MGMLQTNQNCSQKESKSRVILLSASTIQFRNLLPPPSPQNPLPISTVWKQIVLLVLVLQQWVLRDCTPHVAELHLLTECAMSSKYLLHLHKILCRPVFMEFVCNESN
jgi:hypothetical protein